MKTEIISESNESKIDFRAYEDKTITGSAKVLSDGHHWAFLYDVEAKSRETFNELMHHLTDKLKGQEIFTVVSADRISLYESLGFKRSKNSFSYFGENLTKSQEKELTDSGLYLPIGYRYETEFEHFAGTFPVGRKSVKKNVNVTYTKSNEKIDFEQVNELLEKAFGSERDKAETEETFLSSRYVQYAFDKEKMIGCARAISDGSHALILNVAVNPEYQGLHLGWNVVTKLAAQMEGQSIFLNTHPGGVGFYNRKGFRRNKTALLYPAHEMPEDIAKGFALPVGYRFPEEYER